MRAAMFRLCFAICAVLLAMTTGGAQRTAHARPTVQDSTTRTVVVLEFAGPVTPILKTYLEQGIRRGQDSGAAALVLRLDTPGGSVDVTQRIIQTMLGSPVPIIVYIAPAGARAGSAGTFVTLAGHLAAMAPGTSIGAASPIDMTGADVDETLKAKLVNLLSADIENLAARRGDAATEWAIAAVQDAAAATADQALEIGVIDLIAADLPDLLRQANGRSVTVNGTAVTLNTAEAVTVEHAMSGIQRGLNLLADPTLATILLSLGVLGLVVEIRTPGFGFAGILGALALVMAFFGLGQLEANFAGLILMALALVLFIAEAFTPTFGVLSLGGAIAFVLGGALLFDIPGVRVPWATLIALAMVVGGLTVLAGYLALRAQRRPIASGSEALIGMRGRVQADFSAAEQGTVFVMGELWNARLTTGALAAGDNALIVGRDGFTLIVAPVTAPNLQP
jgi:membrane-bound serine protease (ClpP class)